MFVNSKRGENLTVGDLRRLSESEKKEVRSQVDKYTNTLRNSDAFFRERRKEVYAMIEQLGDPHVFATHSHADTHCPFLHQFIVEWAVADMASHPEWNPFRASLQPSEAASIKMENLRRYPHLAALFFHLKTELYIEHIAKPILGAC